MFLKHCTAHAEIRADTRAWHARLRNSLKKALWKEAVTSLKLECAAPGPCLCHDELRQVIRDVLLRFDLRPETVTMRQVKAETGRQLGVSEEELLLGFRAENQLMNQADASDSFAKLSWLVFCRAPMDVNA